MNFGKYDQVGESPEKKLGNYFSYVNLTNVVNRGHLAHKLRKTKFFTKSGKVRKNIKKLGNYFSYVNLTNVVNRGHLAHKLRKIRPSRRKSEKKLGNYFFICKFD